MNIHMRKLPTPYYCFLIHLVADIESFGRILCGTECNQLIAHLDDNPQQLTSAPTDCFSDATAHCYCRRNAMESIKLINDDVLSLHVLVLNRNCGCPICNAAAVCGISTESHGPTDIQLVSPDRGTAFLNRRLRPQHPLKLPDRFENTS